MSVCFEHTITKSEWGFADADPGCIEIGLVNNMPGGALEATERQFRNLLDAATGGLMVRLSLIALPEIPRSGEGKLRIASSYRSAADLWNRRLDGIIVTGAEPVASNLPAEPYWGSLTKLLDWAECNTHSAVWSCLAAHAAVLHADGIKRRPLGTKLSGIFECERVSNDPLTVRVPTRSSMPHSRWNDVPAAVLSDCGYEVLMRSKEAGVCAFAKQKKSLFVYFQGHPEYDADTLLLEYRRDMRRFLRGERETCPAIPEGCFGTSATAALMAFQERAVSERREELMGEFPRPELAEGLRQIDSIASGAARHNTAWRAAAERIYRNWLLHLCAAKARRLRARPRRKEPREAGLARVSAARVNGAGVNVAGVNEIAVNAIFESITPVGLEGSGRDRELGK